MKVIKTKYTLLPKQGEFLFGFDPALLHRIDPKSGKEKTYNVIAVIAQR